MPVSPEKNASFSTDHESGVDKWPEFIFENGDWPKFKRRNWNRRIERRQKPGTSESPTYEFRIVESLVIYGEFAKPDLHTSNPAFWSYQFALDGTGSPGFIQQTIISSPIYQYGSANHVIKSKGGYVTHYIESPSQLQSDWSVDEYNIDDAENVNMSLLTVALRRVDIDWTDDPAENPA